MVERGSGTIVNVASRLGQMGVAETAAYSAAKAGLIGLTRALAREFGPRGIRVNAVAPGVTVTDMTTDLVDSEEGRRRLRDMPLGRFGRADEVADAVHLPALRRVEPVPRPDAQPERRRVHAVSRLKVIDVREAVGLVRDGSTVLIGGSGAGHAVPQRFIDELAAVFTAEGRPRDLTTVRIVGIGDFADRGFSQLGLPGLMRRTIGSNIGNEPRLGALVEANEIESYSFPQGVLSQLMREIAAGRPGLVTQVGPRHVRGPAPDRRQAERRARPRTSSRSSPCAAASGCSIHAFPIDVAVIRGTTADEDGNLTMEGEAVQGEMLAMAMAARNSGGIVIAQVRQLATRGSLRTARRQGAGRAHRPRLRRSGPVADVHHPRLAVLRGRPAPAGPPGAAAAARRPQDHRPPVAARVPAAARSATSASGSASSSAGWPGRRASPTSWC